MSYELNDEDLEIWLEEIKSLDKLFKKLLLPPPSPKSQTIPNEITPPQKKKHKTSSNKRKKLALNDKSDVDTNTIREIDKGKYRIDASLDLHGLDRYAAFDKLKHLVTHAYQNRQRLLLIITGKGGASKQGILREKIESWVNSPEIRPYIVRISQAAKHHGGDGAFYLLIKRKRD
jgi:DNA-nicking Smr family endonuclease